ncbi:DUF305 domain-containing protein [uncultured Nocardioides sp.]|uniref:DUF305 domain-containing protein n=1 Tax=uncultured Nocardioides sp. TaxID=198441 RepID=UPI00260D5281|nr:DUF305 domain-containing protein [uncultured Nocardioides sp.]
MAEDSAGHRDTTTSGSEEQEQHDVSGNGNGNGRMYLRFGLMILTSTVLMFALTYTNVFSIDHVRFSEERVYMAVLMGSMMALVMLAFMAGMMYRDRRLNAIVVVVALVLGGTALYLSRSQALVEDESYMNAMIPHHSIAILTSERAGIDDLRVRELADAIAATQRKEIKEMDWLVQDIEEHGPATTREEADARPVPDFSSASASATSIRLLWDALGAVSARPLGLP